MRWKMGRRRGASSESRRPPRSLPPAPFPDLLHPNQTGYDKWASALQPLLATHGFVETLSPAFEVEAGFVRIFNGKDLTGWGFRNQRTQEKTAIFDGKKENFYTWMRGKHEILSNGHIALSSPQQGRVFEVDQKGEVVFEFVNHYDDQKSMLVSELITLPTEFFESAAFKPCPSNQ